jgi:uncharacterized protein
MKVLVDADACPVKDIIIMIAKEYDLKVHMFIDTSHILDLKYGQVTVVDRERDSVDIALINKTEKGDIVVTQDFGVATMALGKNAYAINQNGLIYSKDNIDQLLFERHLSQKSRKAGIKTSNQRKRRREDSEKFEKVFRILCRKVIDE